MSVTKTNVLTGRTPLTQEFFAQVRNTVVHCNGLDDNKVYHLEKGSLDLGMAAPAAPTGATSSTGLTGNYRYRVKWHDRITGTLSLSSAELSVTLTNQGYEITQPSSPPSRATHWIIERVTADGSVFFPVNQNTSTPYGTAIATTTYVDTVTDQVLRNRTIFPNTQARPPVMRFVFSHNNRVFGLGGTVYEATVTTSTGSAAVTGTSSNFTTNMPDMFFSIKNGTGKLYRILSRASTTSLTLTENIVAGDNVTGGTAFIYPYRNRLWWSEAGYPEHFGTQEAGGPSNEIGIGARGESLVSGCSMGQSGILLASDKTLYYLSYTDNPSPIQGDGRIVPIPTKRHAAGPSCLKFVEGYVYGIDRFGIWRMAPNGRPEDISAPLQYDFKTNALSICDSEKWHIQYDATKRWIKFYVTGTSNTSADYPDKCFVWDPGRERWVHEKVYPLGITCGCEIEDKRGGLRSGIWQQAPGASSSVGSIFLCDDEALGYALPPGGSPNSGTVTGGSTTTITDSGANFNTTAVGSYVTVYDSSGGVFQTRIILSSTSTTITVETAFSFTVASGDLYWVGPIYTRVRSPQLTADNPIRKKKWIGLRIPVKYKSSAVPFMVRAYYDMSDTSDTDQQVSDTVDGVTWTSSDADKTVDPTVNEYVYFVPLNGKWAHSLTFEIYSISAGKPWEINGPITVEYENDPSFMPAAKE